MNLLIHFGNIKLKKNLFFKTFSWCINVFKNYNCCKLYFKRCIKVENESEVSNEKFTTKETYQIFPNFQYQPELNNDLRKKA